MQNVTTIGNGPARPRRMSGWPAGHRTTRRGLSRGAALTCGLACFDLAGQVQRACYGMDHTRRALRTVPSLTATGSPTAPIGLPFRCLDFAFWLSFPGANNVAVWASMQQLDIGLSFHHGNRLMLRRGANGNLWAGAATYGNIIRTVCTIASGATTLAVAAPTSASVVFSAQTWLQTTLPAGSRSMRAWPGNRSSCRPATATTRSATSFAATSTRRTSR